MCVGKAKAAAGGEGPSSATQASGHRHATPGARVRLAPPATGEAWSGPGGLRGAQEQGTARGLAWGPIWSLDFLQRLLVTDLFGPCSGLPSP